jgi:glycosyltransferase involved in cell wall biosynthesis
MKVVHIIDSGGLYGAEMVVLNLVEEQIKLGLRPTIASIGEKFIDEKPLETAALKRDLPVKKFRMSPGPNLSGALKILRFAKKENFDLLHSHGYKGNVLFGLIPSAVRKLPLVATLHGYTSTNKFSKNKFYEICDAFSLRFINAVVLVNKGMLSNPRLKDRKGINFHIVNNGIPLPDAFSNDQTLQSSTKVDEHLINFCKQGFAIGTIGRLAKEKGYLYLIDALKILITKGIDARLVIIGEGGQRKSLENRVLECRLSDRILLPGYREEAKNYLPHFNVFAMSSLTEGLPITLLEAMQAKVPIVSTVAGGIPEVLAEGESGLLVEFCNSIALADAIERIYKDKNLSRALIEAAHHRVTTKYTSQAMAQKYTKIYHSLK